MGIIVVNHSMRLMKNIKALHWISSYLGLRADGELQRQDYLLLSKKHSETVQKLFGSIQIQKQINEMQKVLFSEARQFFLEERFIRTAFRLL